MSTPKNFAALENIEALKRHADALLAGLLDEQRQQPAGMLRTLAIDFDGVIHAYSDGWRDGSIYDVPIEGAFSGLRKLMVNNCVYILTTRDAVQVVDWIKENSDLEAAVVPLEQDKWMVRNVLGVTNRKLLARAFVDDRAVRFINWRDTVNLLG